MKIKTFLLDRVVVYDLLDSDLLLSGENTVLPVSSLPEPRMIDREGDICTIWFPQYGFSRVWISELDFGPTEDI